MKIKLTPLLIVAMLLSASATRAQSNSQSNEEAGITVNTETANSSNTNPQQTTQQSSQPSINTGSAVGKDSQSSGADMNKAIGAMMIAMGSAQKPPNMPMIMMGVMALMQSAQDSKDAGKSAATFDASRYGTNTNDTGAGQDSATADNANGLTSASGRQAISELSKAGYTVNADGTFTGPDGKKITGNDFSSASAMQSAGFDAKSSADAAALAAKVNAESGVSGARTASLGVDGGGGGGGGSGGDSSEESASYKNPWLLSGADKRKMVEGKSVNFAGEPIGVRGDNLFDMVHRAYERKVKADNFIDPTTVSVRAPASAKRK